MDDEFLKLKQTKRRYQDFYDLRRELILLRLLARDTGELTRPIISIPKRVGKNVNFSWAIVPSVSAISEDLMSLEALCGLAERFHQERLLQGDVVEKLKAYIAERKKPS